MSDVASLRAELARLLALLTEARAAGNIALVELVTEAAAKCLVKIGDATMASPAPQDRQQPVVQQQQQTQPEQPDKDQADKDQANKDQADTDEPDKPLTP